MTRWGPVRLPFVCGVSCDDLHVDVSCAGGHAADLLTCMGELVILAVGVVWGTTGLAAHYAPAGVNPFAIGAGAMGFGGVLMALTACRQHHRQVAWRPLRTPLLWGVTALTFYPLCFYGAMHYAGIAVGTAVNIGSSPVMAMMIEAISGRGRFTLRKVLAAGLAIVGLALLCRGGQTDGAGAEHPVWGVVLGLFAGLGYAGYSAAAHEMIQRGCPSNVAMGRIFGVAAMFLVPLCLVLGGPALADVRTVGVLAYLAIVTQAVAYLAFGYGLRTVSASTAMTLSLVEPVVAAVLAVIVVAEPMALIGWCGMAMVLTGVLALGRERHEEESPQEADALAEVEAVA